MPSYTVESAGEALYTLAYMCKIDGRKVSPRGQETYEIPAVTIELLNPTDCLSTGMGRKFNTKLAALEALQLIGGFSDPGLMATASPATSQFLDGGTFAGAYGPRILPQMDAVVRRLGTDPDTRQAIATIWDPTYDLQVQPRDIPCTVYLSWYVRDGKLDMHVHMRSNDIFLGFPYDVVQFTQLQCTLAQYLDYEVGVYRHYADSLHLYARDWERVQEMTSPPMKKDRTRIDGICCNFEYGDYFTSIAKVARDITYLNERATVFEQPVDGEAWFIDQMRKLRGA